MPYLAPSLQKLFDEVNDRWPSRDTWSDGWLGDPAHASRQSDHNPDPSGMVHAADIDATLTQQTMGPGTVGDFICAEILERCRDGRLDQVVNYIIYRGRIYSRSASYVGRTYYGINAHESHIHISIHYTNTAETYAGSWGIRGDWFDMATKADLDAVIKANVDAIARAVWAVKLEDPTSTATPKARYTAGGWLRGANKRRDQIIAALKR